tara:strand:+ start:738 stop:1415 length:678 start_codon:yes stop_codon:yes gene_type:complete
VFLFIGCEDLFKNDTIYGCLDESACNYSLNANTNDQDLCYFCYLDDCEAYPNQSYDCDGFCTDIIDECGVCGGDGVDSDNDGICDDIDPCVGNNGYNNGYSCSDIHVLFDFINSNPSLDSCSVSDGKLISADSINTLGITDWEGGKLTRLQLPDLDLINVPESINNLSELNFLFLNDNDLISLPETFCELPIGCQIYIQNNNLCDEYTTIEWNCINQFEPQDCQE